MLRGFASDRCSLRRMATLEQATEDIITGIDQFEDRHRWDIDKSIAMEQNTTTLLRVLCVAGRSP